MGNRFGISPSVPTSIAQTEEVDVSTYQDDSGPSHRGTPPPAAAKYGLQDPLAPDDSPQEALRKLTMVDKPKSDGSQSGIGGSLEDDNTMLENTTAFERNVAHDAARPEPPQRPWAEPPIVNYTETLDRQIKWQKLFARLPSVTPEQRCRIFDLVGENDALHLYISSLPDSGDIHGEFADGLFEEVHQDQRAVEEELNGFMDRERLTEKIEELRRSLPWEDWCAIWCDGRHQRDCPAAEGD